MHPTGVGSPLVIGSLEVVLDDGSGKLFRPSNVEPLVQDPGTKKRSEKMGCNFLELTEVHLKNRDGSPVRVI